MNFEAIAISKTRINKNMSKISNIYLIIMPLNSPLLTLQQEEL